MVEVFTAAFLLLSAGFLVWIANRFNPIFAFLGGMLVLVFGVALLGSGIEYETGITDFHNTTYNYTNFTKQVNNFNNIGVLQTYTTENVPVLSFSNETSGEIKTFASDTGAVNQGLSLFFILLGVLIMYLSAVELTRPKSFIASGGEMNFQGEEE